MPLFRFGQNWDPFADFEREVDRMLHSVNMTLHGLRVGRQYPAINLYERKAEYLLTAELPSTRLEDIELTCSGNILTLKGRRFDSADVDEHRFRRRERFRGEWQRAISLPDRVADDQISATFTDGILKVRLPKGAESPIRQIPIAQGDLPSPETLKNPVLPKSSLPESSSPEQENPPDVG